MSQTQNLDNWYSLSYEEKNHQLFLKQKAMLDGFLEHGAISQAQHDKSLHDLAEKMGESECSFLKYSRINFSYSLHIRCSSRKPINFVLPSEVVDNVQ